MDIRTMVTSGYDLWSPQTTSDSTDVFGRGTIELESNWQLIAVPVQFGYWDKTLHSLVHDGVTIAKFKNYILDQIDDLYGPGNIEVANTYVGDLNAFYSFIPGSTPDSSPNNFQLVYSDGVSKEISGFWIKSVAVISMLISWGE